MANIEISVIIPVYNSEKYLRECLDSVFNQSFTLPYEVIASANGSTDGSLDILKEYKKSHDNLVILNDPVNKGAAKARVDGIQVSKGKYLAFIDSDDLYHKDFLAIMYGEITKGYDIVGCNFFYKYEKTTKRSLLSASYTLDSVHAAHALLRDYTMRGYMWNKMYRRELFTDIKVYYPKDPKTLFEDIVTLYNVLLHINTYKAIRNPLYYYRKSKTSVTSAVNPERFNHHLYAFAFIRYLIDQKEDPRYYKAFKSTFLRTRASLYYDANLLKKKLGHSPLKHLRMFKRELNLLKKTKPLPVEGEVWEQYIKDCLL